MTYKDNFVVEVKHKGRILRVKDNTVYLPFGSEYSLLLKNLNSRKASIKIHIDDQDVLDYSSLILEPNSSTELEGFLSGTVARNKFKFIKKTKEIQNYRGDRIDDGLVRVEFAFEKPKPEVMKKIIERHDHHHYHYDYYHWWPSFTYTYNSNDIIGVNSGDMTRGISKGSDGTGDFKSSGFSADPSVVSCCYNVQQDSLGVESLGQPLDDEGITVKGSECYQSFRYGSVGELEQSKVIIIKLKGLASSGIEVEKSVTVKDKLTCSSCGTKSKSSFKFCPNCGTFLE